MKTTIRLIFLSLILLQSCASDKKQIHYIYEYSYRVDNNSPEIPRDSVLKTAVSKFRYYDKDNNLMEFILYENSGRIHEKSIYTRDNNGNALSGKKENSKRQVKSSWEYFYNSKDELLEIKTYNLKGELSYRQLNVFDTKGNQIKMILENIKQNSSRETTYKYNSNGEKTEQINFNPDKSFKDKRTYKYDSRGNEIEQVLVQSDSSYIRFDSKYDEYNNLIIQKWYNKKGEQTQETSYLYVYDDYGNWITKKRLSKNVLNMVWERKLKYY